MHCCSMVITSVHGSNSLTASPLYATHHFLVFNSLSTAQVARFKSVYYSSELDLVSSESHFVSLLFERLYLERLA